MDPPTEECPPHQGLSPPRMAPPNKAPSASSSPQPLSRALAGARTRSPGRGDFPAQQRADFSFIFQAALPSRRRTPPSLTSAAHQAGCPARPSLSPPALGSEARALPPSPSGADPGQSSRGKRCPTPPPHTTALPGTAPGGALRAPGLSEITPVGNRKEELTPGGPLGLALRHDLRAAQERTFLYLLRASQRSPSPARWELWMPGLSPKGQDCLLPPAPHAFLGKRVPEVQPAVTVRIPLGSGTAAGELGSKRRFSRPP